ncbi:PucR family transcriptional regulator ligand-binding domain-containing protein [Nocardia sp. NPDC005978]|uniref:helix-turn-helix domain-containing protein n=1 Tax=Nocardia sp. NPDC005978 TaxID=3156725 RepID=UPI00339F4B78
MRVRDILDAPQLRMRLLHGDEAALERQVARVCTTDMPDPRPFVTPGALVCTGLVWRHAPGDSDRYIEMLDAAGAAGVVAGRALHGHVPEDVVAACERRGLPLLASPQSVPFSRVVEHLAEQAAEARWGRVRSDAEQQRRLLAAVAGGSDIGELLADVAAAQRISAWLVTATGRVVAGTAPLTEDELDPVVATALGAPRLPAVTAGAMRVLQVGTGDRMTAWYLVIRPSTPDPAPVAADLAAVAELYRRRAADRLHLDWELTDRFPAPHTDRPAASTVALVCEVQLPGAHVAAPPFPFGAGPGLSDGDPRNAPGRAPDSTGISLGRAPIRTPGGGGTVPGGDSGGAHPADPGHAAEAGRDSSREGADVVAVVRAVLHDALPGITTSVDHEGRLVGVCAGAQDEVVRALRRRLGRLTPALNGIRLTLGVSARQPGESMSGAVAAAAAAATVRDDERPIAVRAADLDTAADLFTAVPGGLRRRFAERVLGPVLDYDRKNNAGLLDTLEVFLACEGSWRESAARMHLHLNTVRYRIGRVADLTGRDPNRLDDRLDLYLAVRTLSGRAALAEK